jgi:dolichyl-diphosphooligosaccharide--protein glycosyltransferase
MRFAPIALFLLALAVRLVTWPSVFREKGVLPYGNDAFYHLRRIQYSVEHFPASLDFDPLINFPNGGQVIWPPTLDWLIAAGYWIAGISDPGRIERSAMFVPPLVGAATVVLLYVLALKLYSRSVALLAAGTLCILPAHFYYSQLGMLDHHVAVAFLATLLLTATVGLFRVPAGPPQSDGAGLLRGGGVGLAIAANLLVWPGALLHVAIVEIAMVVRLLHAPSVPSAVALSRQFALANFVACIAVAPLSLGNEWTFWGSFSAVVLSNFQPTALLLAGLSFGVPGLLWQRGWAAGGRLERSLAAGATALGLGVLLFAVFPETTAVLSDAWAWLFRSERFQVVVRESQPLFGDFLPKDRARASRLLSWFVYVVPVVIWLQWRDSGARPDRRLFLWWALALFAATLTQWRFMNSYSVAQPVLMAWTAVCVYDYAGSRLGDRPRARPIASILAGLAVALVLYPSLGGYGLSLESIRRSLSGEQPRLTVWLHERFLVVQAAEWLRQHGAPLEGPGYSVMGPWGDGHILKYVAGRPVVQDNFGDDVAVENFELAEAYFASDNEREALDLLERVKARYVLVRASGSGHRAREYAPDSMLSRLYRFKARRGSSAGGEATTREPIPALERHRLVHACPASPSRRAPGRPYCALWEIVEGAQIEGDADAGALVKLSLDLWTRGGIAFTYRATTRAGALGRYTLRIPYATEPFSPDVQAGPQATLRSGDRAGKLAIAESAVRNGERIEGPALQTPP